MTPVTWQRAESVALAAAFALAGPVAFGYAWWWPLVLFLAFDLSALGYVGGTRAGATLYNAGHNYIGPVLAAGAFALTSADALMILALAWGFHVAVDRGLGYGLKLPDDFQHTHLGWIGRARTPAGEHAEGA
ncbi:DUF4260 family protein [Demequina mangrovi]|uniref:DUF4260 domain-containing protein n=1 Tax=Demequina mangrovi TaxID=1043493 RepID=A0A1H6YZD8_9MICO|nr:DUF4260 family protein [Demequina mangrovi]SEJ46613.1 protein of unknown function [Demequina mangrovi]